MIFLDRLRLSETQRRVLASVATEFERSGRWLTFDELAYDAADQDLPSPLDEVHRLPSVLGGASSGEEVWLTGLGLLAAGTAPRTAELLARLAEICAERKARLRDEATITEEALISEHGLSSEEAARSRQLVALLPGLSGGNSSGQDGWSLQIFRGALDYRSVHDVDGLIDVLIAKADKQLRLTAHRTTAAMAVVGIPARRPEEYVWRNGAVRLFVSHLADHKRIAAEVSSKLEAVGVHGFVAHDDIEVSLEWQAEIEAALETMDALVALLHPGFSRSAWTQQEIGWALGRGVPVLMVRLGEDPTAFAGRWQAPASDENPTRIASSIAMWLTKQDRIGPTVLDNLVADLANAHSFIDAKQAALRFEEIDRLPAGVLDRLAEAYYANDQIYPAHVGAQVLERIFRKHHREWPPPRR